MRLVDQLEVNNAAMFPPNADVLLKANAHNNLPPFQTSTDPSSNRFGRQIYKYSSPPTTTASSQTSGITAQPPPTSLNIGQPTFLTSFQQHNQKKKHQTYQTNPSNQTGRRRFNNTTITSSTSNSSNSTFVSHLPKKASLDLGVQQHPTVHHYGPPTYANLFADPQTHQFAQFSQHLVMSSIASTPSPAISLKTHHVSSHQSSPTNKSSNSSSNNSSGASSTTSSITSPSYSLDFLHYVGVQMTAGHGLIPSVDQNHTSNHRNAMVNSNSSTGSTSTNNSNNSNNAVLRKNQNLFSGTTGVPLPARHYEKTSCNPSPTPASVSPSIGYYQPQPAGQQQSAKSPTGFYHLGHHFQHAISQPHHILAAQQQQHQQNQQVSFHMNNNYHTNNRNIPVGGKKNWYNNYGKNKKTMPSQPPLHQQQQQPQQQQQQHHPINHNNNNINTNNNNTNINTNNYSTKSNNTNNNNNNVNSNNYVGIGQRKSSESFDSGSSKVTNANISNGNNTTISCTGRPSTVAANRPQKGTTPSLSSSNTSITTTLSTKQPVPIQPTVSTSPRLPVSVARGPTNNESQLKQYRSTSNTGDYDSDSSHSSYSHGTGSGNGQQYKSGSSGSTTPSTCECNKDGTSSTSSSGINTIGGPVGALSFYRAESDPGIMWSNASYPFNMAGGSGTYHYHNPGSMELSNGLRDHFLNEQQQKQRSFTGRNSPQVNSRGRRNINNHYGTGHRMSQPESQPFTPPDRFLGRAHLVEQKKPPEALLNGSKYDSLSQMIWNRWCGAQQTEDTYKKKMYLWRYLYLCVKKTFPRYSLYLVGSTISGFGSETSDVDMCLVSRLITDMEPRMEAVIHLTHLQNHLINTTGIFESFNLIQAKVPILRFKDSLHMLEVDLNFNNCVGIRNTHLLYCYSQMDWRLRPLVLVVKLWAQFHNINNAKDMTISSYSLVLMTIHFLQCAVSPPVLPCLHAMYPDKFQTVHDINQIDMNEDLDPYYSDNTQSLGELFLKFLEYYSTFAYSHCAISIRTAMLLPIDECRMARSPKNDPHQWKELCIEEPFDLTNTARSVYDTLIFEQIKNVFVRSCRTLHDTMDLDSLFVQPFLTPTSGSPLGVPMVANSTVCDASTSTSSCSSSVTDTSS